VCQYTHLHTIHPTVICVCAARTAGDYTEKLSEEAFAELPARARSHELFHDKKLDMFFDDPDCFRKVKDLRGLQCLPCAVESGDADSGRTGEQHGSLKA